MALNGQNACEAPKYTRGANGGKLRSIVDYIIVQNDLFPNCAPVKIDQTDIGTSDHFLV